MHNKFHKKRSVPYRDRGLARLAALALEGFHDFHALNDLAEHDVLAIKPAERPHIEWALISRQRQKKGLHRISPLGLNSAKKELASVGVGARVGHGEDACTERYLAKWPRCIK